MTRDRSRLLEHFSFGKCEQLGGFYPLKKNLMVLARLSPI
jgi:hypothetical protein